MFHRQSLRGRIGKAVFTTQRYFAILDLHRAIRPERPLDLHRPLLQKSLLNFLLMQESHAPPYRSFANPKPPKGYTTNLISIDPERSFANLKPQKGYTTIYNAEIAFKCCSGALPGHAPPNVPNPN